MLELELLLEEVLDVVEDDVVDDDVVELRRLQAPDSFRLIPEPYS